ncbi:hypothetical protein B7P43_G18252 [Cryptotermes secundus]|uniref:Pre-C2HC domain-containing protein n=1 Tax=Cryptotermes secundus TaxID=105785 RepID=A0A2J7Q7U0_9NEOP|nr:hypothetical protein B7P43_G18252 [Cryptotermes secundus]
MANNIIKINCNSPETYRKMINFMRENNIIFHSYQPRDERAYKIVIKHLHHTVELKDITEELAELGHKVRNIINAKHRQTKEPLNLFFVDLEPANNNKEVYKIRSLQNKIIEIEPPNKSKHIIQCTRCQLYGHSKTYCNRPYLCVKCGGHHNSTACKKSRDTPAKCGLCGGLHPANYKGCEYYHNLTKNRKATQKMQIPNDNYTTAPDPHPVAPLPNTLPILPPRVNRSYADVTRGRRSKLSLENKILIYKTVIIPIWTYGIELWGCACKSNTNIIQRSQSKILRMLVDAPWYVSNETLHKDLKLKFVKDIILDRSRQHMSKIETHENELLQPLREPTNNRRLKRKWPNDLI